RTLERGGCRVAVLQQQADRQEVANQRRRDGRPPGDVRRLHVMGNCSHGNPFASTLFFPAPAGRNSLVRVIRASDRAPGRDPCLRRSRPMRATTGISAEELAGRRERLLEHLRSESLSGYVLFGDKYIQYFTSFGFLATERPVALVQAARGEMAVFVPEFEVERVRAETDFDRVESYPEYPGLEHPMRILARVLDDMGVTRAIGAD